LFLIDLTQSRNVAVRRRSATLAAREGYWPGTSAETLPPSGGLPWKAGHPRQRTDDPWPPLRLPL